MSRIWVCDFYAQAGSREDLPAWITCDWNGRSDEFRVQLARKHKFGLPIEAEDLPSKMFGNYSDEKVGQLPNMFGGNGYLIVDKRCADVLKQFDLGQGGLYPVAIFEHDQITPVEGTYFIFNVGNQKKTVVPVESKKVKKARGNPDWLPRFGLHNDEDITVLSASSWGADIWIDPEFWDCIFFNDTVFHALQSQGMFGKLNTKKCGVLQA